MSARLGEQQLRILIMLGSPTGALLTTDRVSDSLVRRGLLREHRSGGAVCITPDGLRALADAMADGRVDDAIEAMRKDAEQRRAKARRAA